MSSSSLDNFLKQKKEVKKFISGKISIKARKQIVGIILDKELTRQF